MEQDCKLAAFLNPKLGAANGLDVLKDIRAKYPSKTVGNGLTARYY